MPLERLARPDAAEELAGYENRFAAIEKELAGSRATRPRSNDSRHQFRRNDGDPRRAGDLR
jgi:hypothetical protein